MNRNNCARFWQSCACFLCFSGQEAGIMSYYIFILFHFSTISQWRNTGIRRLRTMNYKTVEINENRSEKIHYPENGFPVIRMQNALDDFFNGEIGYHWHSEFQFGLLLKGELDYCVFRNPISKLHRSLQAGDGFLSTPKFFTVIDRQSPDRKSFSSVFPSASFLLCPSAMHTRKLFCPSCTPPFSAPSSRQKRKKISPSCDFSVNFTHWTPWITTTSFTVWNCSAASGGSCRRCSEKSVDRAPLRPSSRRNSA